MAERPVFVTMDQAPFSRPVLVPFVWNSGLAKSQKQKNILALHKAYKSMYPKDSVLEISSKSLQPYGDALSAFYLCKYVPSLERSVPVEVIYQAAKTFKNGGPFLDLLEGSSRSAKKDERLKTSGDLISFTFEDQTYPIFPRTAFYDYLYVNALMENETLADEVLKYDAFTDIEFNPNKGVNCQARAAAMFVSLHRLGRLSEVKSFDTFLALYKGVR